ncbi:NAD(P)-binding domain-containing protein, partial [Streptomyces goshikiensis]|uniref:NAD(P)-binding domain-containing protein n=1 Tax=Streptomyces goshikiensis TaxID=1942 RepID=UPI0036579BD5
MRLGIIGTGRIGSTLARILVAADHEVVLANSRGPRSIGPLLAELGPGGLCGGPPHKKEEHQQLRVVSSPFRGAVPL